MGRCPRQADRPADPEAMSHWQHPTAKKEEIKVMSPSVQLGTCSLYHQTTLKALQRQHCPGSKTECPWPSQGCTKAAHLTEVTHGLTYCNSQSWSTCGWVWKPSLAFSPSVHVPRTLSGETRISKTISPYLCPHGTCILTAAFFSFKKFFIMDKKFM